MAAYLSIRHKMTNEVYNSSKLIEVDDMLARAMGQEPHSENWFEGWMDWAGFSMALRADKPIADALSVYMKPSQFGEPNPASVAICQWFIDNFENASYHGF
jgi:hypothetical protein